MKHILFLLLVGILVSGCTTQAATIPEKSRIVDSEKGKDLRKLMGMVSFRMAPDGVREIVLRAVNNTKSNLWVPMSSRGLRGMGGAEAVNLEEVEGVGHFEDGDLRQDKPGADGKPGT